MISPGRQARGADLSAGFGFPSKKIAFNSKEYFGQIKLISLQKRRR